MADTNKSRNGRHSAQGQRSGEELPEYFPLRITGAIGALNEPRMVYSEGLGNSSNTTTSLTDGKTETEK